MSDFDDLPPGAKALAQTMAYYKHSMNGLEMEAWKRIIDEFGDDAVILFMTDHMRSSEFAPKLSEALKMFRPSDRNSTAAFQELIRELRRVGPYQPPVFQDPALHGAVLLMGGWVRVCEEVVDDIGSFESTAYIKRFDVSYRQACSDLVFHRQVATKMRGLHDLSQQPAGLLGHSQRSISDQSRDARDDGDDGVIDMEPPSRRRAEGPRA